MEVKKFEEDFVPSNSNSIVVTHDAYRGVSEILLRRLVDKQIPVLILADGILEFRNSWNQNHKSSAGVFNPVLGHKLACIGPSQCRFVETWGNQGKCENVGLPRLDDFEIFAPPKKNPPRILICSARSPWFSSFDKKKVIRALLDLKNKSKSYERRGICNFVWRLTGELPTILKIKLS